MSDQHKECIPLMHRNHKFSTNLMEECSLQPLLVLLFDSHTVQSFPCICQKCVSVAMLVALVVVLGHLHVLLPEVAEFVRFQELQGALRGDCLDL